MEYKGKMIFDVEHDSTYADIRVIIDFDKTFKYNPEGETFTTMESIKDMVQFWANWQEDLKECDNDYVRCFLFSLAKQAFRVGLYHDWNEQGIIDHFAEAEGWSNMDGSHGIEIYSFSNMVLSADDFTFKKVK